MSLSTVPPLQPFKLGVSVTIAEPVPSQSSFHIMLGIGGKSDAHATVTSPGGFCNTGAVSSKSVIFCV